ncbi:DNRLRE domain-containing protein [Planococcus halotolerans]|uniref:DNRLRE domain-containing protein n=1 Tax=Planococcus halotolerans TaxID=2233542 RepID=UPI001092A1E5|nr:DNRLRE domain-containing protein [Planococcus halotolerans]QHJ71349.1 DNRLRE domain-containing protein [Planococcus halotolerans]
MKNATKLLVILLSILLIFTSLPWQQMAQAEGNELAEYEERLGLNGPDNPYTIEMEDPEADVAPVTYTNGDEPVYPEEGEMVEERTENSKVFSNGDGTFTEEIYPEPIHNEDAAGDWQDISTDLKEDTKEEKISGENTKLEVVFPSVVDDTYVTIQNDGNTLKYELLSAEGPAGVVQALPPTIDYTENTIFHREIFPAVDLRSILFDTSLKEDLILTEAADYHTFHYQVHTSLKGKLNEDGSISWTENEEEIFTTPAPVMSDSNVDEFSGEAVRSEDLAFSLEKNELGYLVTLTADPEWLSSPDREYPIYIDPTTSLPTSADSFVSSAYPTANYDSYWDSNGGYYSLRAGYFDASSGTQFSYLQQNVAHLKGATIDSATFSVYTSHSYYPTTATGLWIDAVSAAWSPSTLTWNNKPASTAITSTNVYKGQWANFNVTSTVQQWATGTKANYGFKLHTNGNGQTYWKRFYASENSTNKPYLSVTYSYPTPAAPTVKATNNNDGTDTGYLDVSWPSVPGATDYIVYLYNGASYQGFRTGNATSWSTKGQNLWPTEEQLYNGKYQLSSNGQGQELPVDPSETYQVSGGTYGDRTLYFVRVAAVYEAGRSGMSSANIPYIPLSKPTGTVSNTSIYLDDATGYLSTTWNPVPLAQGYKVYLFNGKTYEQVADLPVDPTKPDQALKWSSQGKKLWPTAADISAGRYQLRLDGTGVELAKDPSAVYQVGGYGANKNYYTRVVAYTTSTHPQSVNSNVARAQMPDKQEPLGLEAYWPTLSTPAGTVNAINGNLTFSETDASLSGRGPSIEIARTYNSLSDQVGSFGKGWLFSYDIRLDELSNKDVQLTEEDGTVHVYKYISEGVYAQPHGLYLPITSTATTFTLTTKNQDKLHFERGTSEFKGRLLKIVDGDKSSNVIGLSWSSNLLTITDASGRVTKITFTGSNGLITKVEDYGGRVWSYAYTNGQLTSYMDPTGATYSYTYENGLLKTINDALNKQTVMGYDASKRLTSVKDAVGKITSLAYGSGQASITHPATQTYNGEASSSPAAGTAVSSVDTLTYTGAGNPATLITDAGTGKLNLKTTYTYSLHELIKTVDPRTGTETAVYDGEGNVLEVVGANQETTLASYNENNDVVSITDPLKETYTTAYDGVLAVTSNDPSKTSAITEYDAHGNVIRSSKELSVAFNLLQNGGFEENATSYTGWKYSAGGGDTGTIALTTSGVKQQRALTITPQPSSTLPMGSLSSLSAIQTVQAEEFTLYTLSGLLKTSNLGGRAFFNIRFKGTKTDGTSYHIGWKDNRYHYLTGTNPWTERQLSFETPAGTTHFDVYLETDNGAKGLSGGSATFDNIQLEYGGVSSTYNPVLNSGFEVASSGLPTAFNHWDDSAGALKGVLDEEVTFDGTASVKVLRKKTTDPIFLMKQTIPVNQLADKPEALTVSALSKAETVLNGTAATGQGAYAIKLTARDYDNVAMLSVVGYFALGTHDWQKAIASINPAKPIKDITIELSFRGETTGTVWFDSVRLQEGLVATSSAYDAKGNVLEVQTDELGYATRYKHDNWGNQTSITDAKGFVTSYTYNKANQLETTSLPDSDAQIYYTYDGNGNNKDKIVRSKTNPATIYGKTSYDYDDAGQLQTQTVHADGKTYVTDFDYNSRGEVSLTTYPTGSKVSVLYDSADRSTGMMHTLPDGTVQQVSAFKLDGNGNQAEIHNLLTDTKTFQKFDSGNRVTRQSNGSSLTTGPAIDWKFDANDNVTEETISNGTVNYKHQFNYNSLNYNTELIDPSNGKYRFQYDETGNFKAYSAPNGTGALFVYDDRSFVKSIDIGHNNINGLIKFDYIYDSNGNRLKQHITQQFAKGATLTGTAEYNYDSMNQLKLESIPFTGETITYKYDAVGNREQKQVTKNGTVTQTIDHVFNGRNQLIEIKNGTSSTNWQYDDNGNVLDDGKFTYQWDADNRLRKVTDKATAVLIAEYWYDAADRRIRKNANGSVTNYIYDGDGLNVLYETNASNTITAYHSYNANGQLMARTEVNGSTNTHYYYHYNAHGDVVMVTNGNGSDKSNLIVASYVYDAWGNTVYQEGPYAEQNPYRYAGYQFDKETQNYYLMARYYNSEVGIFISKDNDSGEIDNILTQNGYSYTANNPVDFIDQDGNSRQNNKYKLIGGGSSSGGGSTYKGTMPQVSFSNKLTSQGWKTHIANRGWTVSSIQYTMKFPYAIRSGINRYNNNAPTFAYFNKNGSYVVKDRTTGKIIQVSDKNSKNWKVDKDIKNPYLPKRN